MSFFNGTIVTKKLRNTIDTFFRNTLKNEQRLYPSGCSYCTTDIETKCKKAFQSLHGGFSSSKNFPAERWEKLGFITFKW